MSLSIGGKDLFLSLASSENVSPSARAAIGLSASRVYALLQTDQFDNKELMETLALLTNNFRTYTHSSSTAMGAVEKLMFSHAFVDLTDDIRALMLHKLAERKEAESNQSYTAWIASLVSTAVFGEDRAKITEEEFIQGIDEFQDAMKNPDLEISLTEVKQFLSLALEMQDKGDEAAGVQKMELRELFAYMEQLHAAKREDALDEAGQLKVCSASYVLQAYRMISDALQVLQEKAGEGIESMRRMAFAYKEAKAREFVADFKPEAFFEGKSFQEVIQNLIDDLLQESKLDATPIAPAAKWGAAKLQRNLADNLERVCAERNMARVGVRMTDGLCAVVQALGEIDEDATSEDFLEKLGYPEATTFEEFKTKIGERASVNIARLISENPGELSKKKKGMAQKLWNMFAQSLKKLARSFTRSILKTTIHNKADPAALILGYMPKEIPMKTFVQTLGLEAQAGKLEAHAEIIMLHLADQLLAELARIAKESYHQKDSDVSGYHSSEEANAALRSAANRLGQELTQLRPSESSSLTQKGLYTLCCLFGATLGQKQGTGDSLFDITTPMVRELGPAWKDWLTKPS